MRGFAKTIFSGILGCLAILPQTLPLQAEDLIPERRFALSQDADLPGGDLATMLDTTIEACERACLATKGCTAFTFNTRNGSCFPKSNPGEEAFYAGAYSGRVLSNDPAIIKRAETRRGELSFIYGYDISNAYNQANKFSNLHTTGQWSAQDHLNWSADAESSGNLSQALGYMGAAVNLTDDAAHWAEYARLAYATSNLNNVNQGDLRNRAFLATVNAYLRADKAPFRHTVLVQMAEILEKNGRGRDMVQALRLAQSLQPRDDTATMLDDAIGKYGFRILEHDVQADAARPRVCANFSEDIILSGTDYSTYVQVPEAGLTVETTGTRTLCVEGLQHGVALYRDLPRRAACRRWRNPEQIGANHGVCAGSHPVGQLSGPGLCLAETGWCVASD